MIKLAAQPPGGVTSGGTLLKTSISFSHTRGVDLVPVQFVKAINCSPRKLSKVKKKMYITSCFFFYDFFFKHGFSLRR